MLPQVQGEVESFFVCVPEAIPSIPGAQAFTVFVCALTNSGFNIEVDKGSDVASFFHIAEEIKLKSFASFIFLCLHRGQCVLSGWNRRSTRS